ncbi:MAG: glycosyltransferase family 2 protein, partial [Paracoccaceae bacterium]
MLPFLRDALRAAPAAGRWLVRRDPSDKAAIKAALRFGEPRPMTSALTSELFQDNDAPPQKVVLGGKITIVMPVYNAFAVLQESLDRVLRHTEMAWHLILVEDCSTDGRVRPWLRDWAAARNAALAGQVSLIENATNLGFIGSVNLALDQARAIGDPVVLLNSDALVPAGWASRLIQPLVELPKVASVTPMSNDAEIFSVPVICARSDLNPGDADAVDALARTFSAAVKGVQAPTGVGFCMALNPKYLALVPKLDTAFGRGYGEEVDWCQKVRAKGGQHLGIANLFVEHRGGGSFGSADKQRLVAANNAIISRRYPTYDLEVHDFIRQDPLAAPRLALALFLAARRQPQGTAMPIYLAHSLGGGAEHYLIDRIERDVADGGSAVVLRVGGAFRWQVEVHGTSGKVVGVTQDFAVVTRLLASVTSRRIVYSCGVGAGDPMVLPGALLSLADDGRHKIEVLFHDFFPISPSYTLLNSQGVFTGVPLSGTDDAAHQSRGADGKTVALRIWQETWGRLIRKA